VTREEAAIRGDGQLPEYETSRRRSGAVVPVPAGRRVTIRDVARLSGMSVATVTRTFQESPRVGRDARRRVEEAAGLLGYRPDPVAQALASGRSLTDLGLTIGFLVPSLGDRFWGEVADGIEERAARFGFSVILATSHGDSTRARNALRILGDKGVEGVITAGSAPSEGRQVVEINPEDLLTPDDLVKAALFETGPSRVEAIVSRRRGQFEVVFDDFAGARLAVEYLTALGHERVAFVGLAPTRSAVMRALGLRHGLDEANLRASAIIACEPNLEATEQAVSALLRSSARPTAIVAYDDIVAIAAIRVGHALGMDIPRDLSVLGFDDIDVAAYLEPPLTTVRQPKKLMGAAAVEMLLGRPDPELPVTRRLLGGELVIRGSTSIPGP
jgi:DNA-binding LacI/PurR family transcriptional regulator